MQQMQQMQQGKGKGQQTMWGPSPGGMPGQMPAPQQRQLFDPNKPAPAQQKAAGGKNQNKTKADKAETKAKVLGERIMPSHLLTSGRLKASNWPKKSAPVTKDGRMTKSDLEYVIKIQLYQVQSMMAGAGCDSFNRTVCAHRGETIPVLNPQRKDDPKRRAGNALDNALGRPTALSIKNPRPLLQMVTPEELAAARAEADAEADQPGSPVKKAQGSWRMAMMRTIEDCHSCIVEYEDLKFMDDTEASPNDKAEMRQLMQTLVDRIFSTFTGGKDGDGAAAINDDVLVTISGIAKGRRLLGRILPLLSGKRRDEFLRALLRNLARICNEISKSRDPKSAGGGKTQDEIFAEYLIAGVSELDLSSVRSQLVNTYQVSKELDAQNVFVLPVGCVVLAAIVQRGVHLISIGKSEERSRSQWQAALKDILMFCTMYCVAICSVGDDSSALFASAGAGLVKAVVEGYKPYMSEEQMEELSMCFSANGLQPTELGFA